MHATGTPEWVTGIEGELGVPTPGDAWTLSWDGVHEGVVVIAQVHTDFILGIPLTDGRASATEVEVSLGEERVVLWPQAETGLGDFLLHTRLGRAVDDDELKELRLWAADRGDLTLLQPGAGDVDEDKLRDILVDYQRRCFIEWPSESEVIIDVDATGMTAREFRSATGFDTPRVLEMWGGDLLTSDEIVALGDNAEGWTTTARDVLTREFSTPEVKSLIVELCNAAEISERAARNHARSAYALAARTDSVSDRTSTRAEDTIRLLIQEAHAS